MLMDVNDKKVMYTCLYSRSDQLIVTSLEGPPSRRPTSYKIWQMYQYYFKQKINLILLLEINVCWAYLFLIKR